MPLANITRRMTVVRLRDGRLVIFNAIALDEDEMRALEEFGKPVFLVVPNGHHRLDARGASQRCASSHPQARSQVSRRSSPLTRRLRTSAIPASPSSLFLEHVRARSPLRSRDQTDDLVSTMVGNMPKTSGFGGWFLHLMRFAGDKPRVPVPVKFTMIRDKAALAAQLRRWAALPSLKRVLVSHGKAIEDDPPSVMRKLAASLG